MAHAPDYTLYAVPIASFLLLFALEYVICAKTRRTLLRAAPFLAPWLRQYSPCAACALRPTAFLTCAGWPPRFTLPTPPSVHCPLALPAWPFICAAAPCSAAARKNNPIAPARPCLQPGAFCIFSFISKFSTGFLRFHLQFFAVFRVIFVFSAIFQIPSCKMYCDVVR